MSEITMKCLACYIVGVAAGISIGCIIRDWQARRRADRKLFKSLDMKP